MTKNPQNRPSRRVLFVGFPGAQLLDIVGPLEVFDTANRLALHRERPAPYELEVAAPTTPFATTSGLRVCATALRRAKVPHTLVVGGKLELAEAVAPPPWLDELRRLTLRAMRIVSVCTGSFLLGELGLLDRRRCTTHWLALDALRARFPTARVETDALYTHDGRIFTSAGVTSGIDLALHLVERDLGAAVALAVARALVVFLHRPGGQTQFSASMKVRAADQRIRELLAEVVAHPAADHSVEALAKRVAMSPRHFARVFRDQAGTTPAAFVETARLDAARSELELTDDTIAQVAETCGFGTDETLRRVFHRALRVSPADYRRRFQRNLKPGDRDS